VHLILPSKDDEQPPPNHKPPWYFSDVMPAQFGIVCIAGLSTANAAPDGERYCLHLQRATRATARRYDDA
jgi:hypothetical protein